ncbi:carbohydrate ABC transporter membrane protein 2 (CUT1 family) [Kribbella amoyensis]|uniref:Carbohydrate ABC transporter membrane protein 2 (CUT1 family) n=1 Tax=Kribbella amoyensis TaxID=996641 RepID=A0A561B8W0_9ACTN|nr:carbohydrate ABC transporter permease [Kribbella amoyensis]TWD75207.1 carbohydrate ABC transporter membrane protein 2 (CUT1 family) [Kribbella amoyensis]
MSAIRLARVRTNVAKPAPVKVRGLGRIVFLTVTSILMLVPMYLLVVSAFKSQQDILAHPFSLSPDLLTTEYLQKAWTNPDFNIVKGYAVTALFVVSVNLLSVALAGPVSYVIARRTEKRFRVLLLLFVAGTFIPSQVLVIPVVYTLKYLGLMGTIPGFVLFETTLTLPFSIFLYAGYIMTIPASLDEAASVDGAGKHRVFWSIVFPLMKPAVVTMVILNTFSVWNDFVNPQIILGPGSGLYTVTTGVYAAVSQYSTDYTVVFPTLLLAVAPLLVVFVLLQRHVISGLTAGATKG